MIYLTLVYLIMNLTVALTLTFTRRASFSVVESIQKNRARSVHCQKETEKAKPLKCRKYSTTVSSITTLMVRADWPSEFSVIKRNTNTSPHSFSIPIHEEEIKIIIINSIMCLELTSPQKCSSKSFDFWLLFSKRDADAVLLVYLHSWDGLLKFSSLWINEIQPRIDITSNNRM